MSSRAKFVYRETALVYSLEGSSLYGVLAWPERPLVGMTAADADELRPATQADFGRFRVCSKGHL